jgi:GNAT superfamily N-acetyltransferase
MRERPAAHGGMVSQGDPDKQGVRPPSRCYALSMHTTESRGDYEISTEPGRLDRRAIHAFLSTSYWATGIPLPTVEKSLERSLCFGVYTHGNQVGLARIVTDGATFGYLCDVYILEEHRGHGLGQWLMECVMRHPELASLRRFSLVTRDAHSLYRKVGFETLVDGSRHMEVVRPDLYLRNQPPQSTITDGQLV